MTGEVHRELGTRSVLHVYAVIPTCRVIATYWITAANRARSLICNDRHKYIHLNKQQFVMVNFIEEITLQQSVAMGTTTDLPAEAGLLVLAY
jgi:hypothetical protein